MRRRCSHQYPRARHATLHLTPPPTPCTPTETHNPQTLPLLRCVTTTHNAQNLRNPTTPSTQPGPAAGKASHPPRLRTKRSKAAYWKHRRARRPPPFLFVRRITFRSKTPRGPSSLSSRDVARAVPEAAIVLRFRHPPRTLPRRARVPRAWRLHAQRFVRTLLVILAAKAVKGPLLRPSIGCRRRGRLLL